MSRVCVTLFLMVVYPALRSDSHAYRKYNTVPAFPVSRPTSGTLSSWKSILTVTRSGTGVKFAWCSGASWPRHVHCTSTLASTLTNCCLYYAVNYPIGNITLASTQIASIYSQSSKCLNIRHNRSLHSNSSTSRRQTMMTRATGRMLAPNSTSGLNANW